MTEPTRPCGTCGMPCTPGEYHPYAACLMFKACHNSETVRANLEAVRGTPPTQAQAGAVPLTVSQIREWWASENGLEDCEMCKITDFLRVVRAVEEKHGIKGGLHGAK